MAFRVRTDAVGIFWEDQTASRKRGAVQRIMPPIPDTGWRPPRDFPNLSGAECLSIDLEVNDPEFDDFGPGWARGKGEIAGGSIGTPEGNRWYFPKAHTIQKEHNIDPEKWHMFFRDTLKSKKLKSIVGANLLYDLGWLAQETCYDYWERRPDLELVDVTFGEALLDETALVRLDALASKYLGEHKKGEVVFKWCADFYGGKPTAIQRANLWRAPPCLVGPYGESDADLPLRVAPYIYERLVREDLLEQFRFQCRLIPVLIAMRFAGVSVDVKKAEEAKIALDKRIVIENKKLTLMAGCELNVNATSDLGPALEKLGIKVPRTDASSKHPDGQLSVTKPWLERLEHPIGHQIREIRRLQKAANTFIQSYIINSNVKGKIHGMFHPLRGEDGGTKVNRFSGSHPNLQNVQIRDSELGPLIRGIFKPNPGDLWWRKFDYSQIQYRSLVHWAVGPGSDAARENYIKNPKTDYHKMAQALIEKIFGVLLPRRPVKNINFGLSFGMGLEKLLADIISYALAEMNRQPDIRSILERMATRMGAQEFLDVYHKALPFVKPTIDHFSKLASSQGFLISIDGYKSRFDLWEPKKWSPGGDHKPALPYTLALQTYGSIRRAHVHKALNRQLQIDEGSIFKLCLLKAWDDGVLDVISPPCLMVHDEFDFSEPEGQYVEEGFQEFKRIGETVVTLKVPIIMEEERVHDWGECK